MVDGKIDITDPFYYGWFTICFFLAIWFTSNVIRFVMETFTPKSIREKFVVLDEEKQRNCVTYVMEILVTTFALICQLYGGQDVLFKRSDITTPELMNWMTMSLQSISVLYVWELIYRERFGWPLLLHHLVTLLFVQLVVVSFFTEYQMLYIRFALILGFYATTEQTSFIALFCFRLKIFEKHLSTMFYVSAIQTFVIKTLVTISALIYYAICVHDGSLHKDGHTNWGKFWALMFVPLLGLLFFAQLFATNILYIIAKRCYLEFNVDKIEAKRQEFASSKASTSRSALRRGSVRILDTFENTTRDVDMGTSIRRSISIVRPSVRRSSMRGIPTLQFDPEEYADSDDDSEYRPSTRGTLSRQKTVRILDSFENSKRSSNDELENVDVEQGVYPSIPGGSQNSTESETTIEDSEKKQQQVNSDKNSNKVHVLHHTIPHDEVQHDQNKTGSSPTRQQQEQKNKGDDTRTNNQDDNTSTKKVNDYGYSSNLYSQSMFGDIEMSFDNFIGMFNSPKSEDKDKAKTQGLDNSIDEGDTAHLAAGYRKSDAPTPGRQGSI